MEKSAQLQVQGALAAKKNAGVLEVLEERQISFLAGIRTPERPACSILTILTELSRLRFIHTHTHTHKHTQGIAGGMCQTSAECSLR